MNQLHAHRNGFVRSSYFFFVFVGGVYVQALRRERKLRVDHVLYEYFCVCDAFYIVAGLLASSTAGACGGEPIGLLGLEIVLNNSQKLLLC